MIASGPLNLIVATGCLATVLTLGSRSQASVSFGTGLSSATSGRIVPTLALGWSKGEWAVTGVSAGSRTRLYAHSAWTLNLFRTWSADDFGWGAVSAGFGVGLAYSRRSYRDAPSSALDRADDLNAGPAFRVSWRFLDPVFLSVEAMYGLKRPGPLLLLSAQDHAALTLGVAF